MRFERADRFKRSYRDLSKEDQEQVDRALSLLANQGLSYPSLKVKKMEGTADIFEARASIALRFTFQIGDDVIILRVVGRHDEVRRRP